MYCYFAANKIKIRIMDKTNLKLLSEKEMSQLVGGKWVEFEGRWVWISEERNESDRTNDWPLGQPLSSTLL